MATLPDPISHIEVVHTLNPDLDRTLRRLVAAAEGLAASAANVAGHFGRIVDLMESELADGDD